MLIWQESFAELHQFVPTKRIRMFDIVDTFFSYVNNVFEQRIRNVRRIILADDCHIASEKRSRKIFISVEEGDDIG